MAGSHEATEQESSELHSTGALTHCADAQPQAAWHICGLFA
jgi:hypothetical protein